MLILFALGSEAMSDGAAKEQEMLRGRRGAPSGGEAQWPFQQLNHASRAPFRTREAPTLCTQLAHAAGFTDVFFAYAELVNPSPFSAAPKEQEILRGRSGAPPRGETQ